MMIMMMLMLMMTTFQARFEVFLVYFFVCLDFLKRILIPNIFIHDIFKLRRHLGTKTYGRFPWQFCNFRCEIINYNYNIMGDEVLLDFGAKFV